ncbi:DNA-binding pseudobarrel domain-containing protein [Tanacetum coccineum]
MAPSCFKVLLDPASPHLRLPENFVGLPGIDREGTIMMKNLAGKEWRMGIRLDKSYLTEHYYLSTGWCKFRRYNKLSEGDKCVFKYIRSERLRLFKRCNKPKAMNVYSSSSQMKANMSSQIHQEKPATKVVKRTQGPRTRQHGGRVYMESEDECVEVVKRGHGRPRKQ